MLDGGITLKVSENACEPKSSLGATYLQINFANPQIRVRFGSNLDHEKVFPVMLTARTNEYGTSKDYGNSERLDAAQNRQPSSAEFSFGL